MVRFRRSRPATTAPASSGRYTPPKPSTAHHSAPWVPTLMFSTLGCGLLVIVTNYLELLPGDGARNSYLFLGLGLVVAGFVVSTRYR